VSAAWRHAAAILAGGALLLGAGGHLLDSGLSASRAPRRLTAVESALRQLGGEPGLAARRSLLTGLRARLAERQRAHAADADALSRRIETVCADLGLQLTAASAWTPVPRFKLAGAAAFERTLTGRGSFAALLDALATFESWPDEIRIRRLSLGGQDAGGVVFTIELAAVRSAAVREGS
jgi:hypothetical protein